MYPQPQDYVFMDIHVLHVCTSPRHDKWYQRLPQSALRLDRGYPYNQPLRGWCAAHSEITHPTEQTSCHGTMMQCMLETIHPMSVSTMLWCLEEVHYMANPRLRERSDRSLGP